MNIIKNSLILFLLTSCTAPKTKISQKWQDNYGNLVKSESFSQEKLGFSSYLPIISYFLPRYYENQEKITVFDAKNHIIEEKLLQNEAKVTSAFFCNSPPYSCIISVK